MLDIPHYKNTWVQIANDLYNERNINERQRKEFIDKLSEVDNLHGLMSFIQWLGCTLCALCTLGGSLFSDEVRNRVFHPTKGRIFSRLKDATKGLNAPLQQVHNLDDDRML